MDEQIIPCFNASKPPVGPAMVGGSSHGGALRKTRSVTYGMSVLDQAVPTAMFVPMHVPPPAVFPPAGTAHVVPTAPAPSSYMAMPMGVHMQHVPVHLGGMAVGAPIIAPAVSQPNPSFKELSPESQPPRAQKPRWETPLRVGNWAEDWESAPELADDAPTSVDEQRQVSRTIRSIIAEVLILYVGDQLPRPTVDKWLCLLAEYLELNADEQILVLCLLRRYVDCDGLFIGEGDNLRPQIWERVVAVCCYLAVLLSEEFPGRAASDLRELLGPNFRFGSEQISFLKKVNWRISVSHEFFMETKKAVVTKDHSVLLGWFKSAKKATLRKQHAAAAAQQAKESLAALASAQTSKPSADEQLIVTKKRTLTEISQADDGVVPGTVGTSTNIALDVVPYWSY